MNTIIKSGKYKNLKNGEIYDTKNKVAINATNTQDGQIMILYQDKNETLFVREISEFLEKFEKVKEGE